MVELSDENLNVVFREARTFSAWTNQPVADEIIRKIYELAKWGPTSANSGRPLRVSPIPGGEGEIKTGASGRQRGEDDDGASHGDRRLRSQVL